MNIAENYGVPLYKRPSFRSNGRVMQKEDEWLIMTGSGASSYNAFLSAYLDASRNNDITVAFRSGTDHNTTPNGNISGFKYTTSDIQSKATKTVAGLTTFVAHGGRQLTDPSTFVTPSGRLFIFFLYEPTGKRQLWYRFSDDGGATFSSEIRMTLDYDDNQITSPGEPFLWDGKIYKPCYARGVGAGSREGVLYSKGLSDDFSVQNSWTKEPTLIYQIENFNGEEPTMQAMSNGLWFTLVRSDPDNKMYRIYSLDKGATYSRIQNAFPGLSKAGFDITPSGTIFGTCRENGGSFRTMFWYTNDMGKTFNYEYDNFNTDAHMYGRAIWHHGLNKGVYLWAVENSNSVTSIYGATFTEL